MKRAGICLLFVLLPLVLLCGCIRIIPRVDTDTTDGSAAVTTAAVSVTTAEEPVTTVPIETSVTTSVVTTVMTTAVTRTETSVETETEPEITTTELPATFPNDGEDGFTKRY